MAVASVAVGLVILDGRAKRWEGVCLVVAYAFAVAAFWIAGG